MGKNLLTKGTASAMTALAAEVRFFESYRAKSSLSALSSSQTMGERRTSGDKALMGPSAVSLVLERGNCRSPHFAIQVSPLEISNEIPPLRSLWYVEVHLGIRYD